MNIWELIDTTQIPGGHAEMTLHKKGDDFSICVKDGGELMNTRMHGSEESLAKLGCKKLEGKEGGRVLVGGLGMGFTLAATLHHVGPKALVEVAELVPAVEKWNREYFGPYANFPLNDFRSVVKIADVADVLRANPNSYDAILLDVDNGPTGMTQEKNSWLYWPEGLHVIAESLRTGGVLAVWSAYPDRAFHKRLVGMGFKVEEHRVGARTGGGGGRHTIWVAE